jgi:transposase InsO family protein
VRRRRRRRRRRRSNAAVRLSFVICQMSLKRSKGGNEPLLSLWCLGKLTFVVK